MLKDLSLLFTASTLCLFAGATNVPSDVIELNERFLQVKDDGFWFVEFYAPWCAHCKRLMPIWEHVGHALVDVKSPVRVGKMDCTRYTGPASTLGIQAYPTIIFFRNGKQMPYNGERKKDQMVDFAVRSSGPIVGLFDTYQQLAEQRKSGTEPFFVFVAGEDDAAELYNEYTWVAGNLFSSRSFYRTYNKNLPETMHLSQLPSVMVFKDKSFFVFDSEKDGNLTTWILKERWSLMPMVSSSNIRSVGENRLLVLSVINQFERRNESTQCGKFYSMMLKVAAAARSDLKLSSRYQFGWLDGSDLANNIVMGVVDEPDVLIFNESTYEYYVSGDAPSVMTVNSVLSFLERVATGDVASMGGSSVIQRIKRFFFETTSTFGEMFRAQPLLTVCIFGLPLAFFSLITYCLCSSDFSVDREEVYPEEEDNSDISEAEDHQKAE